MNKDMDANKELQNENTNYESDDYLFYEEAIKFSKSNHLKYSFYEF
jgi:hypothetical protein